MYNLRATGSPTTMYFEPLPYNLRNSSLRVLADDVDGRTEQSIHMYHVSMVFLGNVGMMCAVYVQEIMIHAPRHVCESVCGGGKVMCKYGKVMCKYGKRCGLYMA